MKSLKEVDLFLKLAEEISKVLSDTYSFSVSCSFANDVLAAVANVETEYGYEYWRDEGYYKLVVEGGKTFVYVGGFYGDPVPINIDELISGEDLTSRFDSYYIDAEDVVAVINHDKIPYEVHVVRTKDGCLHPTAKIYDEADSEGIRSVYASIINMTVVFVLYHK